MNKTKIKHQLAFIYSKLLIQYSTNRMSWFVTQITFANFTNEIQLNFLNIQTGSLVFMLFPPFKLAINEFMQKGKQKIKVVRKMVKQHVECIIFIFQYSNISVFKQCVLAFGTNITCFWVPISCHNLCIEIVMTGISTTIDILPPQSFFGYEA